MEGWGGVGVGGRGRSLLGCLLGEGNGGGLCGVRRVDDRVEGEGRG